MRILLTGATGFVGRNLVPCLLREHEVCAVARRPERLPVHPRLTTIRADWVRPPDRRAFPSRIDAVIHLAMANSRFPDAADELFLVNTASTQWLMDYSRHVGVQHFVFASTGDVYGNHLGPTDEATPPSPRSFYGVTKYASELLVRPYERYLSSCILRLYHPYGPAQTNRLIPNLAERVRVGTPIPIHRSSRPNLTPTYIDDVVSAFSLVVERRIAGVYNVAGGALLSIRELTSLVADLLKRRPVFDESGEDPFDLAGDNSRLKNILGDWPKVGLRDGLTRMLSSSPYPQADFTREPSLRS